MNPVSIERKLEDLGGPNSALGEPLHEERATPNGRGRYRTFSGRDGSPWSIHWTPEAGAFETHGSIRELWAKLGFEESFLGFPISDEHDHVEDGVVVGKRSDFEGGRIVWYQETGARRLFRRAGDGFEVADGGDAELPPHIVLEAAYTTAVATYIKKRREMIPSFVERNFGWAGSAERHKHAFGWDLLKAPVNILWSIPVVLTKLVGKGIGLAGYEEQEKWLNKIWPGFTTAVQVESERLIYTELLELPWAGSEGRVSCKNALFEEILNQPEVSKWVDHVLTVIEERSGSDAFRERLEANLQPFATAQTSASDIATNLIVIAGSYASAKEVAFGASGAGTLLSGILAQKIAISSFWAGPTLGSIWYGFFPAKASIGLTAVSVAAAAIVMALLSSFIGVVADPLQKIFGLHAKRLNRALDELEADLNGTGPRGWDTKAPIFARVLDFMEWLSQGLKAL
jgi:hypothetical protein